MQTTTVMTGVPPARSHPHARTRKPLAAGVLLGLAAMPWAQAATIVVTSPGDTDATATNTCTLRQAIVSMNASTLSGNCQNGGAGFGTGDTIHFAPGINTITLADAPRGELVVRSQIKIDAGAGRSIVVERPANASHAFPVFSAAEGGNLAGVPSLHLIGLTIQNGFSDIPIFKYDMFGESHPSGGGIAADHADITLDRCIVRNNRAEFGGGIYLHSGSLVIRSSMIRDNIAERSAGGIATMSGTRIVDSTVSGNQAHGPNGIGAIWSNLGGLSLVNSTVSGNHASQGTAAVYLSKPYAPLLLANSTIACNDSPIAAIHVANAAYTRISAISTIFANTSNSRCTTQTLKEITLGSGSIPITGDHNLVRNGNAAGATFASPILVGDPLLGPLQDNGGPTPTHALPQGSVALNRGGNPSGHAYDQRGAPFSRTTGRSSDIGAFEYPYAGLCGTAHGRSFVSVNASTPGLCANGAFLQDGLIFGSGPWSWFCADIGNPGVNEFCGALVLVNVSLTVTDGNGTPLGSAIHGQPVRLVSTVGGGAGAPSGTVSFFDETDVSASLCVGVPLVNAAGSSSATCNVPSNALGVGTRLLRSSYGGDGSYGAASDNGAFLTVQPAATTTTIESHSPDPATIGSPCTVVAQVTANAPSLATPQGIVTVEDQTDQQSCSYHLAAELPGCSITPHSAGTHALWVTFEGDSDMLASSATSTHVVDRAGSSTVLEPAAPIAWGQSVTVNASVTGAIAGTPSGSIEISDGDTSCNFDPVLAIGCSLTPVAHGALTLVATYSGDAVFSGSSASTALDVVPHTVGGSVSGLTPDNPLVLRLDHDGGSEDLSVVDADTFHFASIVPFGTRYAVSITKPPSNPVEACHLVNASGVMPALDVDDIQITCSDTLFADGFDP